MYSEQFSYWGKQACFHMISTREESKNKNENKIHRNLFACKNVFTDLQIY